MNLEVRYHQRHRGFVILGAKSSDYELAKARCTKNKTPPDNTHSNNSRSRGEATADTRQKSAHETAEKCFENSTHTKKTGKSGYSLLVVYRSSIV